MTPPDLLPRAAAQTPSEAAPHARERRPVRAVVFLYGGALRAPVQRSHQLARHFADRLPVVYVPYRSPVELLQGNAAAEPWPALARHPNVRHVPMPVTTFLARRSGTAARIHGRIAARGVRRALRELRVPPEETLLFMQLALADGVADELPGARIVYDCADDLRNWHHSSPAVGKLYAEAEERLARRAECILFTIPRLLSRFASFPAKKLLVLNGVDLDLFTRPEGRAPLPVPADLAAIPGPRLLCVGVLSAFIDAELIAALARAGLGSVVLVGPVDPRAPVARLRGMPNLYWLGRKSHEALPAYVHASDVGLIPGTAAPASDCVPSKLMMYCAAGLPVVARRCSSLEPFQDRILLAGSPAELVGQVRRALSAPAEGREARLELAARHSWRTLADRILAELSGTLPSLPIAARRP